MVDDMDDYAPVTLTGGDAAEPVAATIIADAPAGGPVGDMEENQPRGQRVISDKVRALFKQIEEKHEGGVESEDLVPVDTTAPDPVAKPAPVTAAAVPAPVVAAAPAAAVVPPPPAAELSAAIADAAAKAAEQARQSQSEAREKAIADREAKLVEREAKLPTRETYNKNTAAAIRDFVRGLTGAETDGEVKDALSDMLSEVTADTLGTPLDDRLRREIEQRKALRTVNGYKADLQRQQEALKAEQLERDTAAKAERESIETQRRAVQAQSALQGLLATEAAKYPFLTHNDDDNPPHLAVWALLERQKNDFVKQYGDAALSQFQADWPAAAKALDDHYKAKAAKAVQRYSSLLAPAAPVAPPVKPSPQVSAQVPRSTTQTAAAAQPDPASPDVPVERWDRDARRNRGRESLKKRFANGSAADE